MPRLVLTLVCTAVFGLFLAGCEGKELHTEGSKILQESERGRGPGR